MIHLYSKSLAFIIAAAMSALLAAETAGPVTPTSAVNVIITIIGAIGLYWAPNLSSGVLVYFKGIIAAVSAGLTILASALITPGVSSAEWLQIGIAALGAIGVLIVPNEVNEH